MPRHPGASVETKAGANTAVVEWHKLKYPRSGHNKAHIARKGAPTAGGWGIVTKLYELQLGFTILPLLGSLCSHSQLPPARSIATSPLWLKTVACGLFLRCFAPPRRALYTREARYCPLSRNCGGPRANRPTVGYADKQGRFSPSAKLSEIKDSEPFIQDNYFVFAASRAIIYVI